MAMPEAFVFRVTATDGTARRGQIDTPHGRFETPAFMPVGTAGTVKALTGRDLLDVGAEIILANTYHLLLRPGDDVIARCGGLHAFMGWDGPILTDSGGYQVFSLGDRRVVTEDGARFRSHLDGSEHLLTPERAVEIQARLGSDIAMAFDECTPYPVSRDVARASMELSLRWGRRSRVRFRTLAQARDEGVTNRRQAQFGIVQGGVFPDLRARSVEETLSIGFDGYAIGGLSVGEPAGVMCDVAAGTAHALPPDRPRYLMGVGTPVDLVEMVACGIDMFDCVLPTRNARNGQLFTRSGPINIKGARYAEDPSPPDETCGCYTCRHHSRAYLRHLFVASEITSATLNTLHNLHFYLDTLKRIREAIMLGSFDSFRQTFRQAYTR